MFGSYNLEDCVSGMITTLGVDSEIAKNLTKSQLDFYKGAVSGFLEFYNKKITGF